MFLQSFKDSLIIPPLLLNHTRERGKTSNVQKHFKKGLKTQ